ncbi:MAG: hypothetical protein ACYCU7_03985 [Acidimicrobiales bacterium]
MADRKWMDQSQPQTLQAAVMLCYINAALAVLFFLVGAGPQLILLLLGVAGYFIANDRRWAYWSAVVIVGLYTVLTVVAFVLGAGIGGLLNLLFALVLFALLVHPQSREYEKVWFH